MSSSTVYEPLRRSRHFIDRDGVLSFSKAENDELRVVIDLTDYLASGETVSSVVYTDSGVTTSSKSVSSPQVIFTATGVGYTTLDITLSTNRTVEKVVRFYQADGPQASDYNL